jgi:hypothetical protein
MKNGIILLCLLLTGCASTQLVNQWKNPDIVIFDASKVLIVAMTRNQETRKDFETRMKREFTKRGIEAVRSIDLFDVAFTDAARSEEELGEVEQQLLDKDFDAILFTKVLGSENRQKFRKHIAELDSYHGRFRDDYISNQRIFYDQDYYDSYKVYHAETALYCICLGKERELIWRSEIEISEPSNISKTIDRYIKLVVLAMRDNDIIFRDEIAGAGASGE